MVAVVSMAFQILQHQLRIASNEVDLGRIFCVQLQLNWFLQKQGRTVAANHLMKTTFLAFCSQFTDFTEGLNTLRCVRSGCLAIGTPDFQKLCPYSPLAKMMSHMCTFNIGHLVLLQDMLFSLLIVTTVVHIKAVGYTRKAFKVYFCNFSEALFATKNWIHDIFAASYCVSVRRRFCYHKSTVSSKLVSS